MKATLDGEREELAKLRKAADQFLSARIQASLEAMDVDMLTQGKQKIRVSYLRSAGIQNMWQLSKLSQQQIEDLDGIGAQGATAIYDLTKQIVKNAKEKLSVRIGIDSPTKADDALVAALYCVIVHGQQRQQLQGLYDRHHKPLTKEIATAQTATRGFSWFFASAKERDSTLTAATARAYRMGQTRDVLVYRLLADETIDERMLEILSAKQKEFDAFAEDSVIGDLQMQSDTSWLTKLVQEEQSRLGQQ